MGDVALHFQGVGIKGDPFTYDDFTEEQLAALKGEKGDDGADAPVTRLCEFIRGTQTTSTVNWAGISVDSVLYDGKVIDYYLPYSGGSNATLTLTMADGSTSAAVPIYVRGDTPIDNNYNAGCIIHMVYDANKNRWQCHPYFNTDTYAMCICPTESVAINKFAYSYGYVPRAGNWLLITLQHPNTSMSHLVISINGIVGTTGGIYINGKNSSSTNYTLPAGTYLVYYDGSSYYFNTDSNIWGTVSYETSQKLTDKQKAQARENIGAAAETDNSGSGVVYLRDDGDGYIYVDYLDEGRIRVNAQQLYDVCNGKSVIVKYWRSEYNSYLMCPAMWTWQDYYGSQSNPENISLVQVYYYAMNDLRQIEIY